MSIEHRDYILKCLEYSEHARGYTSPNPLVGAILTDGYGNILANDYHRGAGSKHAEILTIEQYILQEQGHINSEHILYVNLEPCTHHGKTPPCTDQLIQYGLKNIIIGMKDPNPQVNGQGIAKLQANGIKVISGIEEKQCLWHNRFFVKYITKSKPWIMLKQAITLNGQLARQNNQKISNNNALTLMHQWRSKYDAILTTASTLNHDNAQLTTRLIDRRSPQRIILVWQTIPAIHLEIFRDGRPNIIYSMIDLSHMNYPNTQIYTWNGDMQDLYGDLARQGILSVMIECGGSFGTYLLTNDLVDEYNILLNTSLYSPTQSPVYKDNSDYNLSLRAMNIIGDIVDFEDRELNNTHLHLQYIKL